MQESSSKRKISETDIVDSDSSDCVVIEINKDSGVDKKSSKPECQYGSKCYRSNPSHLNEFSHPLAGQNEQSSKRTKLTENEKKLTSPFLLTKVNSVPQATKINAQHSLGIEDILRLNQDEFVESAQFNYLHDLVWLIEKYPTENQNKPLTVINGEPLNEKYKVITSVYPNISFIRAKLEAYGTHHTKMMFLVYKSGMRVVIHTANLIEQDWHQKTQGIWMSEMFPRIDDANVKKAGMNLKLYDSKTSFKQYLMMYLEYYHEDKLKYWIDLIRNHDMSSANVFLIGSAPGRLASTKKIFGHLRLRKLLSDYSRLDDESHLDRANAKPDQIVCQFSSIGSLGNNESAWLCKEFLNSLSSFKESKNPKSVKTASKPILIFPSVENVRTSFEGYSAGESLPYSISVATKQPYLNNFFFQWKADRAHRSRASPHIKTYARYSHDFSKLYWFLLTSANLSKAAWGSFEKNESQYFIRSYELGVLFIPPISCQDESKLYYDVEVNKSDFIVPYDLPPQKYESTDKPWVLDMSYVDKEDSHGRIWQVSRR